MDYERFYTPPKIAELLIKQLKINSPSIAIDICCGSCNLLFAAKKRWKDISLYGIDIIKHKVPDVKCIKSDGRKYAINRAGKYALVLANPPFDFVKKRREYKKLFSEIESNNKKYETSRLENEMLLANLMLLSESGTLLIIMPSTFIESEKNNSIRKYIAKNYYVNKIIKLPIETFGNAKINTYALIIKKDIPNKKNTYFCNIEYKKNKYQISKILKKAKRNIDNGHWYLEDSNVIDLNNYEIKRGAISSQLFTEKGTPVLHTAKLQDKWKPSIRYISSKPDNEIYAETGDIVISRVGRSAGQWHKYNGKRMLISDCLYCLKDPNNIIKKILKDKKYGLPTKGVSTQYITMKDFLGWYQTLV